VRIDLLTLMPQMCRAVLAAGVVGRAIDNALVRVVVTDVRRFAGDRHGTADDTPYGGGAGMVLRAEPVVEAVESVRQTGAPVILMSPAGRPLRQAVVEELARHQQLVLVCGRYKGVDERIRELVVTDEISIGDYVLSGGELAALVMVDAVVRRLPGVLGNLDSADTDSFSAGRDGLLDAAYYTRPPVYRGLAVPEVLLSGDHAAIDRWRQQSSLQRTHARRPELLPRDGQDGEEQGRR
jgi:tRNA (guanine37-N1)-methyltransferase